MAGDDPWLPDLGSTQELGHAKFFNLGSWPVIRTGFGGGGASREGASNFQVLLEEVDTVPGPGTF